MISIDESDVIVGKRIFIAAFNDDGSIRRIDSTDTIYDDFESAYEDVINPIKSIYGGITDDTVAEEFKGKIAFKRCDFDEDNLGHGMNFLIYRDGKRIIEYDILPVIANKLHHIAYRGVFIKPFNIDRYLIYRRDGRKLTIKKSLDLALAYIDTYLLINPEWE